MPESTERTALYRLYDAEGNLLYVGISKHPEKRLKEHARWKTWWHHVAQKQVVWLDSRGAAVAAEGEAIKVEAPAYNSTYHLGSEWRKKRTAWYDASADVTAMVAALRAALEAGKYMPGSRLLPLRVGPEFGYSPSIADSALSVLAKEGLLLARGGGYSVPR